MFRPMRRFRQQLSDSECEQILKEEPRGVLSVYGEDGYPYGMPVNFLYEDGKLYFHGAKQGHKIDALKKDNRVSFCVYDKGYREEGKLGLNIKSVIIFGRIQPVENPAKREEITRKIGLKYDPADFVGAEVKRTASSVQILELTIDHMTGKLVNES